MSSGIIIDNDLDKKPEEKKGEENGQPAGEEGLQTVFVIMGGVSEGDGVAEAHDLDEFQIGQVVHVRGREVFYEGPGFGHPRPEEDAHPRFDPREEDIGRNNPPFPSGIHIVEHLFTSHHQRGKKSF